MKKEKRKDPYLWVIGSLKLWNTSPNLRTHLPATSRTHKKEKKKKENETEIMNRKGIEESNEKQEAWQCIEDHSLTTGSLNQGFLCEQKGGSGGAEQDMLLWADTLGAKILSERKRKRGKTDLWVLWVELVRLLINWLFSSYQKIKTAQDQFSVSFTKWKLKIVFDFCVK